jgi:hypothetical protein
VALTVDNAGSAVLYVNGIASPGTIEGGGPPRYAVNDGKIVIGNRWAWDRDTFDGSTFNGCIDEVRISGRALSAEEIAAIHRDGEDATCSAEQNKNVAPIVHLDLVDGGVSDEGEIFTSSLGSFTDPDVDDSWSAMVDYGDGSLGEPLPLDGKNFVLSHRYADNGSCEITVTVTDHAGDVDSSSAMVVVNNVAPTIESGPAGNRILEGDTFESTVYFADPGDDSWTATVDYGYEGEAETFQVFAPSFNLSHMYAGNGSGPFTVTVTVTDDDSGADSGTAMVTVVYPLTIDRATVKSDRRRRWRRQGRHTYDVDGGLPLSLLERFESGHAVTVKFPGSVLNIPAGSLVRRTAGGTRSGTTPPDGRSPASRDLSFVTTVASRSKRRVWIWVKSTSVVPSPSPCCSVPTPVPTSVRHRFNWTGGCISARAATTTMTTMIT